MARAHGRSKCASLFAMARIATDNHIRAMGDPVAPARLYPLFASLLARLQERRGLRPFQRLEGRLLMALDGTEYLPRGRCPAPTARGASATTGPPEDRERDLQLA